MSAKRENNLTKMNNFKSKPDPKPRKRKASNENRFVNTKWDIDPADTALIYKDLGLGPLSEDSNSSSKVSSSTSGSTPSIHIPDLSLPPGAPSSQPSSGYSSVKNANEYTSLSPVCRDVTNSCTDSFLLKKPRYLYNRTEDEIILSIFQWLPKHVLIKCARVCKRWFCLVMDESLWKQVDLSNKTIKPGVLDSILDRGVSIVRMAKTEVEGPICNPLSRFGFQLSMDKPKEYKMQYLDLSMATIDEDCLLNLLQNCHSLKKLSLENLQVNEDICREIGNNTNLDAINMSMVKGLTEDGLLPFLNSCTRLEALNVAWTGLSRGAIQLIALSLPVGLLKLNLSGSRSNITDEDVLYLVRNSPNIKELDLSDSILLTGETIDNIVTYLCGLEYIALSRCYMISPSCLPLLEQCPSLLALNAYNMMKEPSLEILRQSLRSVDINKYPFSSIARPTTGIRRTSIWGMRVRDPVVA